MTTIIMISHNSSVIINHSGEEECAAAGDEEEEDKRSVTDSVTKYDRHNTSIVTFPISSSASQSSSTTSTPDASFITPRPLKSASHGDNVTNGHRAGKSPHRRRLKNSLSTLESDSEDMNITTEGSSGTGSAASTLSSAAYILSSVTYFPSLPEENVGRVTVGSDAMTNMDHSFSCAVTSTPAHSNNNNNHNNNINNVRDQINKKNFFALNGALINCYNFLTTYFCHFFDRIQLQWDFCGRKVSPKMIDQMDVGQMYGFIKWGMPSCAK